MPRVNIDFKQIQLACRKNNLNWHIGVDADPDQSDHERAFLSFHRSFRLIVPGRVAQSVGHLTRKSEVLGSIPGLTNKQTARSSGKLRK